MANNLQRNLDLLFAEAKSAIIAIAMTKQCEHIFFRKPINLCYKSSDSGYMCDDLVLVSANQDVIFLCEGETCTPSYDFDEDEDGIVSAFEFIDDLTIESVCSLADHVCHTKRFYKKFFIIQTSIDSTISSIGKDKVRISPTSVELDFDCHWFHTDAVCVTSEGFYTDNGDFESYEYNDMRGSSIDIYELAKIADAYLSR